MLLLVSLTFALIHVLIFMLITKNLSGLWKQDKNSYDDVSPVAVSAQHEIENISSLNVRVTEAYK